MKKLPLGIQTFRKIIEGGYVYADKTHFIFKLTQSVSYYFLARPRRFGKSLLLDTIAEVFGGDKELFNGLWIYNSGYDFKRHPVIRIDLSGMDTKTPEVLEQSINSHLDMYATSEGFVYNACLPSDKLKELIWKLHQKYAERVVVLVDEYDKPILDHITDIKTAEANRKVIKSFFGVLKSMDAHLRFTFFTGVSKFTKTSLFSELNNLSDITMERDYANICGFANEDIDTMFSDYFNELRKLDEYTALPDAGAGSLRDSIMNWYDGYSWDSINRVYNPFSLLNFFNKKEFLPYWFASGSPGFIIKLIKKNPSLYREAENSITDETALDAMDIDAIAPISLMFQTGYLTVRSVKRQAGSSPVYTLEIPNKEVRDSLGRHIFMSLTETDANAAQSSVQAMIDALESGEPELLETVFKRLFASIPYEIHVDREAYYHSIIYVIMQLLGFDMGAEVSTSRRRIDGVLELASKVYIIEFKYRSGETGDLSMVLDAATAEAMNQINERSYAERYAGSRKEIIKLAIAIAGRDGVKVMAEYA